MKALNEFLKESLVMEGDLYKELSKIIAPKNALNPVMKASGVNDKKVIKAALAFVEASLEGIIEEYGDEAKEQIIQWLHDDFVESFGEYLEDELDMDDDEVEDIDLRGVADAIADLF